MKRLRLFSTCSLTCNKSCPGTAVYYNSTSGTLLVLSRSHSHPPLRNSIVHANYLRKRHVPRPGTTVRVVQYACTMHVMWYVLYCMPGMYASCLDPLDPLPHQWCLPPTDHSILICSSTRSSFLTSPHRHFHFGFEPMVWPASALDGKALIFRLSMAVGGRILVNIEKTRPPPLALHGRLGLVRKSCTV